MMNLRTLLYPRPEILLFGTDSDGGDLNGFLYEDIYNRCGNELTELWSYDDDSNSGTPDLCHGDFDGDGMLEFAVTARRSNGEATLWVYDDCKTKFAEFVSPFFLDNSYCPQMAAGDFDDDGQDEIAWACATVPYNATILVLDYVCLPNTNVWLTSAPFFEMKDISPTNVNEETINDLIVGDFDGDGSEEFLVAITDDVARFHGFIYD